MLVLDELDIKDLEEVYDEALIKRLDVDNVGAIYKYLIDNGIYYVKDLFIENLELFLLEKDMFIEKFEKLKQEVGNDYIEIIGRDSSFLEIMYKD